MRARYIIFLFIIIHMVSCGADDLDITPGVFQKLPSSHTKIKFNNRIEDTERASIRNFDNFYSGGGVAIGDVNNDGLPDIFFAGNLVPNCLYINKGNLKFEEVAEKAGVADKEFWSTGVNMFDFNGDGWLDIYVCHSGPTIFRSRQNHLYINNQDGTFTNKALEFGLVDNSISIQSALIDFDMDGDLDLFLLNNNNFKAMLTNKYQKRSANQKFDIQELAAKSPNANHKFNNILYENLGDNKYRKIDHGLNINRWGFAQGLSITDLNKDNFPDIYVSVDFEIPDFVYYNQGDGTFKDVNKDVLAHNSQSSMGIDVADLNNDTWPDIAICDMVSSDRVRNKTQMNQMNEQVILHLIEDRGYQNQYMFNVLQMNNGNGTFRDVGHLTNTATTDWSWAPLLADFDMDGDKDYFISNGFKRDTKDRDIRKAMIELAETDSGVSDMERLEQYTSTPLLNFVFENKGDYKFEDVSKKWGFTEKSFSNGAAYGDLDGDGDLDLVVNNVDNEAFVYKNTSIEKGKGNYLKVKFGQEPQNLNAKVTIYYDNSIQYQEYHPVRGYASTVEPILYFGLGNAEIVDSVKITWLYGKEKMYTNVNANTTVYASITESVQYKLANKQSTLFSKNVVLGDQIDYKHEENYFWDFDYETLLPHKQSTNGPSIAVGDVNGDDIDDFFVGGAHGQAAKLFIQKNGKFISQSENTWVQHKSHEDIGCTFVDIDNDGDQDLYVVSGGGGEFNHNDSKLIDRIYVNNGYGKFTYQENRLNSIVKSSGSCAKSIDFDQDGDLDLFVGGRLVPRKYPSPARSILWENRDGKLVDVTLEKAPGLERIGLVTDAIWLDVNDDKQLDLIVVGEWMRIEIFEQQQGVFTNATESYGLENTRGWWFSVAAADFDQDGDKDLVVGNLGLNNKFHASEEKPFEIYYNDFDDNGKPDIVLAKMDKGKQYIMRGKDCSSSQMPFIQEKYKTYRDFANAPIEDVLSTQKLDQSLHYSIKDFSSSYFRNDDGKFTRIQLPIEAQQSPLQDIVIKDINNDNLKDIIVAGNLFGAEVETASYDSGIGSVLINKGNNIFDPIPYCQSGILVSKDVRNLEFIEVMGSQHLFVANNNEELEIFKLKK